MCDAANSAETDHPPLASTGDDELFYTEELIQSMFTVMVIYWLSLDCKGVCKGERLYIKSSSK